ncbi:metal ABC transporter solute-binding protein, Zn/Mn family [Oceanobacillus rekensis]|uniref:metal ABC transporter solute-binding protein, Zn/Mn family n=1 Tax=Oceanobacillus rekensis TaxID=937927 RepID=UPI000B44CCA7|nr:zinc ABC transporter substrate-binding protein [Oceanobacillus rekensis]
MSFLKTIPLLLFFILIVAGCSSTEEDSTTNDDKLTIYTSIYPIQYAVERIGGDTVSAKTVFPPGVDAHTYEPTTKDMTSIADSSAFIYMGAGMEGFAESAADALISQDVSLIEIGVHDELFHSEDQHEHDSDAGNGHEETDSHDGHNHGDHDPHIWIDPVRMIEMAEIIKTELITLNPNEEALYNENFTVLEGDLQELDKRFTEVLSNKNDKNILVSHAAYGYWEEKYGLEQIAINGLSSSSEPSQKDLTKIIDQAREYDLNYIIFEQNSSNRVSEIIQEEIGAESLIIHNLAVLTEDDITNNEDYFSLMEHNLEVLDKATN